MSRIPAISSAQRRYMETRYQEEDPHMSIMKSLIANCGMATACSFPVSELEGRGCDNVKSIGRGLSSKTLFLGVALTSRTFSIVSHLYLDSETISPS